MSFELYKGLYQSNGIPAGAAGVALEANWIYIADTLEGIQTQFDGLGTMAQQNANAVAIVGGSIAGITDLAIADGGTGASDAAGARTNLGLGSIATQAANNVAITGGTIKGTPIGDSRDKAPGIFTTLNADTIASGEHTIASDSVGLKLGTAGTGTIYSNGTRIRCGLPLWPTGYIMPSGFSGLTYTIEVPSLDPGYHYSLEFEAGFLKSIQQHAN